MEIEKAITVLTAYNEWRRGGDGTHVEPKIIGEAIDTALEVMNELTKDNFCLDYWKPSKDRIQTCSPKLKEKNV